VIDLPAGLVGDEGTNDPVATAHKELEEETGYTCQSVELLASGPTSPGITSETVSFYRARKVAKAGEGGGVAGEEITVHAIALDTLDAWLEERHRAGVLIDAKIWGARYWLSLS
jgi:ADP-ribose pyrophosphatase